MCELTRRRRARAFVYKHGLAFAQLCQPRIPEPRVRTLVELKLEKAYIDDSAQLRLNVGYLANTVQQTTHAVSA